MKTKFLIAALAATAVFTAPTAFAYAPHARATTVTFAYKLSDTPETIYRKIERKAQRACMGTTIMSASAARAARVCKSALIEAAVTKIGRRDIASVHTTAQDSPLASLS